jgi:dipeptidyl aminopeptidase/acylaminoacyl peptidase
MTADLQQLFDRAGRDGPPSTLDPDAVVRRAVRRTRRRRIAVAVTTAAAVTVAVGVGVATHRPVAVPPPPATLPPATLGHLAYGLDGSIYIADWDGRNPVRIAHGVSECEQYWGEGPMWSPDGRYLVFREGPPGDTSCPATVVIADATGHRVASFPGSGWKVAWAPDSRRVVTWLDDATTIGVYGVDGTRQEKLTLPAGLMAAGDFDPSWSADGRSLLVPHGVLIPLDGTTPHQLPPDDPRTQRRVRYSPDRRSTAYVDYYGALTVARLDGSHPRTLTTLEADDFAWSRAGDRIAFATPAGTATTDRGPVDRLCVVDVATGRLSLLAGTGDQDSLSLLAFSPEGDRILFSATDAKNVSTLWTVRTDGSGARDLGLLTYWGDWQAVTTPR